MGRRGEGRRGGGSGGGDGGSEDGLLHLWSGEGRTEESRWE